MNIYFPIIPEIFLTTMALLLLIVGAVRGDAITSFVTRASGLILFLTAILFFQLWKSDYHALNDLFVTDSFAVFVKILIVLSGAVVVLMSLEYSSRKDKAHFEFPVLQLLSIIGMMVMVSANDLIILYMGLELQSLCLYILASIDRDAPRSSEAGMKYFVLGALSSGLLLYGCSLVYGFTGSTSFTTLADINLSGGSDMALGLMVGIILVIIGICFKVSAVPFHMWTPDVYEGAPTPVTAFFAVAPKVAAMALFVRVMTEPFGHFSGQWVQIIVFVSLASMIVGALGALKQTNVKRLMAYSSIGHAGYMLVGLAAATLSGVQATLIYMAIYAVMGLGVFACILHMRRRGEALERIADFAGLGKTHPLFAMAIAILMFSMAGVPPLAGFFGKLWVFRAAIESGLYGLAIVGVITSVIAAFYYIRIIKLMYFDETDDEMDSEITPELRWVMIGASGFCLLFFVAPTGLFELAKTAATSLFL